MKLPSNKNAIPRRRVTKEKKKKEPQKIFFSLPSVIIRKVMYYVLG